MGYYDKFLIHEGMNSTSNEKGTDGKRNNTSAYNHDYYMKNKEKWQDNKDNAKYSEYKDGDSDFDEANYSEKNRLGDTDFYGFQKSDGSWVILEEDMKWTLPSGMSKADMTKALEDFDKQMEAKRNSGEFYTAKDWQRDATAAINGASKKKSSSSGSKEFDVDAAAKDVMNGKYGNGEERKKALGSDYDKVQKRVNELAKHSEEDDEDVLYHHGIRGQKWGVRRFQTAAGTLTAAGRKRYEAPIKKYTKIKTSKDLRAANTFAKATYKKRKAEIKEEKANSEEGFVKKNLTAMAKNADNRSQLNYNISKNRVAAGANVVKTEAVKGAVKESAKTSAKVGAAVLAGMMAAEYMNYQVKKGGSSPNLPATGLESHYEYKIGKAQVAKALGKAVAVGALYGAAKGASNTYHAQQVVENYDRSDIRKGKPNDRANRYKEDSERWKRGEI